MILKKCTNSYQKSKNKGHLEKGWEKSKNIVYLPKKE